MIVNILKSVENSDYQRFADVSHFELGKDDVTVVIPVLNEEKAIGQVIEKLSDEGYHRVLVIDGYSTDDTVSIADKNGAHVIYQHGKGKTGAIKTAIEHVKTPFFVVMDGDCTYDPGDIKNFIPHLRENDQVIGVRTFGRKNIPLLNRLGNWIINSSFNLVFGSKLLDVCSGMYALRTDFARTLDFNTGGFDVEVEIAAQTARYGSLTQVPINYGERVGEQKLRPFRDGVIIQLSILKLVLRYNPLFFYSVFASISVVPAFFILSWVFWNYFNGIWYPGWAMIGMSLLIISMFALTLSALSALLKRIEQRILQHLSKSGIVARAHSF